MSALLPAVEVVTGAAPRGSVIWLHGLGADGRDFLPIVPELRLPPACAVRFVFPHAPVRTVTINAGMRMRAWYDILGFSPGAAQDEQGIRDSAALVTRLIAEERSGGLDSGQIVLAGFSQGGAIALHAGLRHGEPLGGVLALSTYLPLAEKLEEASSANRGLPILMCHGRYDPVLPLDMAEHSRDLLRERGYAVDWKEYPMQHQVCAAEVVDIAAWLSRRLTPA